MLEIGARRLLGGTLSEHHRVALAHDYITQRGGAERVAIMMARAFPKSPVYTTLYEPTTTFSDFAAIDLRVSPLNRIPAFRRDHRLAFPVLAPTVSSLTVDADVLLASSSGWAHAIRTTGRKVVYCHAPARWLYQRDRYLGTPRGLTPTAKARRAIAAAAVGTLGGALRRWDRRSAMAADRYVVNSTVIRDAVAEVYGIEAEILPPPPAMTPDGPVEPVASVTRPFVLCVARLLPYKNVDVVIQAVRRMDGPDLVVVGKGPDRDRLVGLADGDERIHLMGSISDGELRWLYANSLALVAASYEDYGLSPLEASSFGKPTVALHAGGYLDTVDPGVNGVFFDDAEAESVVAAIDESLRRSWSESRIVDHSLRFAEERFATRLTQIVDRELASA